MIFRACAHVSLPVAANRSKLEVAEWKGEVVVYVSAFALRLWRYSIENAQAVFAIHHSSCDPSCDRLTMPGAKKGLWCPRFLC